MTDLDDQSEQVRGKGRGDDNSGDTEQNIGNDKRVTKFVDWILPILALGVFWHFANKIDKLGDAVIATNTQIALLIEQNKMMQDGFKDHENRIRDLEGHKFRGVPGYGDDEKKEPARGP